MWEVYCLEELWKVWGVGVLGLGGKWGWKVKLEFESYVKICKFFL